MADYTSCDYSFVPGTGDSVRETITHGSHVSPDGIANQTLREINIYDQLGRHVINKRYVYNGSAYELMDWVVYEHDSLGHVVGTYYSDGTSMSAHWSDCCGKEWTEDKTGLRTLYSYDELQRLISQTRGSVTHSYQYDAADRVIKEITSGGTIAITNTVAFDLNGRKTNEINSAGLKTAWNYPAGGLITSCTKPGGGIEITEKYLGGLPKSVTGSAVTPIYTSYDITENGERITYRHYGSASGAYWMANAVNMLEKDVWSRSPEQGVVSNVYDQRGLLVQTIRPDLVDLLSDLSKW